MTTKLNQIIAIEKGIKARVHSEVSELYKLVQKPDLFNGFVKQYQKKDEESEDLPPEKKKVVCNTNETLNKLKDSLIELCDITARKEVTNQAASADVVVDGQTILPQVPVTYLLFLEKQLTDMRTFIGSLPELSSDEDWQIDPNSNLYKTDAIQTHRTKKVNKPIVLYQATDKHPAQTQLITEDVLVGYWQTVKQSGAAAKPVKQNLLDNVEKLLNAVKEAREAANNIDEKEIGGSFGEAIFKYLYTLTLSTTSI